MKYPGKISALLIATMIAGSSFGQNSDCYLKKSFACSKGTALQIINKFGDINIIATRGDSLSVCAIVTIDQNDGVLARKSLKLIRVNIDKLKDTISVLTSFDKKFFSETFRQGRKSFSVDYVVKAPAYLDLRISNSFGNISVEELSGSMNLKLSQGSFSAKKLSRGNINPINIVSVDHGNISIDDVNWITLKVINCPVVTIGKARAIVMTSAVSKINIGEINSLVSDSKSDSYAINSVTNLVSKSTYSMWDIGSLTGQLKSKTTYGSFSISNLSTGFSIVDIIAEESQVSIKPEKDASFTAEVTSTDETLEFPSDKYPGIKKTKTNFSTTLLGSTGTDKESKSIIRIKTSSGKLIIK
jgi:hypothetical protein